MGAGQSTGGGEAAGGGGEVKTSYYEVLGVERTATQDELKKAYRKKALELHPDRNHGDTERTTALFADVQSAYEVLSDDQERAWYDAHEGDILRGGSGEGATEDHYQGNMRMTTTEELTRMMGRFRGNVDFSDAPSGFFGFVRDTFEQLAKEEEYAADYEDIDIPTYPTFGHKDDSYDDVVRDFYSLWNGFATAKSFAWKDVYRLSEAPDRRYRRLMEKENQKHREDARRDFNEAVRTLIAFVRKRDPRYTPNTQSADEKAKAQRDARKAQAARARAAQLAKLEQEAKELPSWATARHADEDEEETEEEIEEDHYECVACNKTFKSERQYEAHEKSKKHQKAIQSLKRKMQKDNAHLHLDEDGISSGHITPADNDFGVSSDTNGLDESVQDIIGKTSELKVEDEGTDEEDDNEHNVPPSPQANTPQSENNSDDDDDDDDYASRSDIEARLNALSTPSASTAPTETTATEPPTPTIEDPAPSETSSTTTPKIGKAAQKRAKKAAQQAKADSEDGAGGQKCLGCDAAFPSKSRLHQHLQDHPRHAAPKVVEGRGKKRGKR
ncbi:DnaJ-domain-containing protein [Ophiobolus disseminans]|uniref:DnaJ-domain-containing protein n=1 Tax=Ophiobolus disseminans TaxID=1469910 RepID=A0A6A7A2S1_9PLEO|nr:DnaJ-domain-containing protein [Ophiobolus disseminans]